MPWNKGRRQSRAGEGKRKQGRRVEYRKCGREEENEIRDLYTVASVLHHQEVN